MEDGFLPALERDLQTGPWAASQRSNWLKFLQEELAELSEAKTQTDIVREAADVLWCLYAYVRSRGITFNEVLAAGYTKLKTRKPWLFDESLDRPQSKEEEHAMYLRNKARETFYTPK